MKQEILSLVPEIKQENGRYVYQGNPEGAISLGKKKWPAHGRAFKRRPLGAKIGPSKRKPKIQFGKKDPGKRVKSEPEEAASLLLALRNKKESGSDAMEVASAIPPGGMNFSKFLESSASNALSDGGQEDLLAGLQRLSLDGAKKPSLDDPSRDMEQEQAVGASPQPKPPGAGMMKF